MLYLVVFPITFNKMYKNIEETEFTVSNQCSLPNGPIFNVKGTELYTSGSKTYPHSMVTCNVIFFYIKRVNVNFALSSWSEIPSGISHGNVLGQPLSSMICLMLKEYCTSYLPNSLCTISK